MRSKLFLPAAMVSLAAISSSVEAGSVATSFTVKLTITAQCVVAADTDMDFGSTGYLTSARDAQATFKVGCTNGTSPTISLASTNTGCPALTPRCMKSSPTTFVNYELYFDSGRTSTWSSASRSPVTGDGAISGSSGSADKTVTVYGRVPAQTTDSPGDYTDTVTATVTF